jgi:hypothetical protein
MAALTAHDLIQIEAQEKEDEQVGPVFSAAVEHGENWRKEGKGEGDMVQPARESVLGSHASLELVVVMAHWRCL